MRIPVIRGRDFPQSDPAGSLPVAIINQALARRLWPHEDAIGKQLTVTIIPDQPPRGIVGVVSDLPLSRWNRTRAPSLYVPQLQESLQYRVPYGQSRISMTFMLRLTQPPDIV